MIEIIKSVPSEPLSDVILHREGIEAIKTETESHKVCLQSIHSYIADTESAVQAFNDYVKTKLIRGLEAQISSLEDLHDIATTYVTQNDTLVSCLASERNKLEALINECSQNEQSFKTTNRLSARTALSYFSIRKIPQFKFNTKKVNNMKSCMEKHIKTVQSSLDICELPKVNFDFKAKTLQNKYELNFNGFKIPYEISHGILYKKKNIDYDAKLIYNFDTDTRPSLLKRIRESEPEHEVYKKAKHE